MINENIESPIETWSGDFVVNNKYINLSVFKYFCELLFVDSYINECG